MQLLAVKEETILLLYYQCCISAFGAYVPRMIIFKRKRKFPDLEISAPAGSVVEISDIVYINTKLFVIWLKHFYSHLKLTEKEPVLVLFFYFNII